jgi:hypothetical protein
LVLLNNSGHPLAVNSEGTIYSVFPGAIREIKYPGNTELLKVESAPNSSWEYKVEYPDRAHMYGNKFWVQIESNGNIYVLPPNTQSSAKELLPQPHGFPWKPKYSAVSENRAR